DRMIAHGLLNEVDVVLLERSEQANGLRECPAAVGVKAETRPSSKRLAHGSDQLEIFRVVEADLEVEDVESVREPVGDLLLEAVGRAAREVVEVRRRGYLLAAEDPPERLTGCASTDVPERHVDAGPGEVAGAGAELPEPVREGVAAHCVAVPRVAA